MRQAKPGASYRVKVPVGQGLAHPPVPSVACGRDRHTVERPARSVHRESCGPQGVRRTPEARNSVVTSIRAVGHVVDVTEADTEESLSGEIPEGLPVSAERGMYEEEHTGTWETLSVPDDKG